MTKEQQENMKALAKSAYLFGFPLVYDVSEIERLTSTALGSFKASTLNEFNHADQLADYESTFVSVNNDTVYSIAHLDLSGGPLVLHVPDVGDRYYVFQFIDAWTNNFAYVGTRGTGSRAGDFFIYPTNWQGDVPAGMTGIESVTELNTLIGRWACDVPEDLPAVVALQQATTLTPFEATGEARGLPQIDPAVPKELEFWERLRVYLQHFPVPARDAELLTSFGPLGITVGGASPFVDPEPELATGLIDGLREGEAELKEIAQSDAAGIVEKTGWISQYHGFDYNADFFEVGTLEDPEWIIQDRQQAIATRAVSAYTALWGNHGYEAAYASTWTDENGEVLDGQVADYILTLAPLPPVDAFWSLTMYDLPNYFLIRNKIDRYSIGDRTPGLIYNDDGSLTIYISENEPTDPVHRANWLPAPGAEFRPMMRLYQPQAAILTRDYQIQGLKRVAKIN